MPDIQEGAQDYAEDETEEDYGGGYVQPAQDFFPRLRLGGLAPRAQK